MSKLVLPVVFLCALMLYPVETQAKSKSSEDAEAEARSEMRKKIEEKKTELNGSSWDIQIKSQGGKGGLVGPDALTFQNGKFSSQALSKKGYSPTNYTLTVQEGAPTIWETMQTSEKEGVTFWRGEWQKETMSGVITRQLEKGSEDYYFLSSGMKKIPPTSEPEEEKGTEPVAALPADADSIFVSGETESAAPIKTETAKPAKEKRSWFF